MNLYLIARTDTPWYGELDFAIIAAGSEADAMAAPIVIEGRGAYSWPTAEPVCVKLIGLAAEGVSGLVRASIIADV